MYELNHHFTIYASTELCGFNIAPLQEKDMNDMPASSKPRSNTLTKFVFRCLTITGNHVYKIRVRRSLPNNLKIN